VVATRSDFIKARIVSGSKELQLPERRILKPPSPHLSAREALGIARPAIAEIGADWFLASLAASGNLGLDGCLLASANSAWQFAYCQEGRSDFIAGFLFSDGTLTFQPQAMPPAIHPPLIAGDWLDSRAVAKIIMAEPDLSDLHEHKTLGMALHASDDGKLFWEAFREAHEIAARQRARTTFGLDALTGEIRSEGYERWDQTRKIKMLIRQRWKGGDWRDAEPDSGGAATTDAPPSTG
jgi:hypothetical protein